MANILLLDDNPIAQKALAGILGRAEHKFAAVKTVEEAFKFILNNVAIDLFIMDMRLQAGGQPLNLIKLIRSNSFLKTMPILIYTSVTGRDNVKAALALRIQNYLIKPYSDDKIFTEIKRAEEWGWIRGHFDDPKTFCKQMNLDMDSWRALLQDLLGQLRGAGPSFKEAVEKKSLDPCNARLGQMIKTSEACGFWTLYDVLNEIVSAADRDQWLRVHSLVASLPMADGFIMHMLEPEHTPAGFADADKFGVQETALAPNSWLREEILARAPFAKAEDVEAEIGKLHAFPIFAGRAAAFKLSADGHGSSVQPVADLVGGDPALSALVLQMINKIENDPDSPIEDSRQAVQMLGGYRMRDVISELVPVPEERFYLPPAQSWQRFLLYQLGCAHVCAFVCEFMEIPIFMPHVYWVGMLHDLGKMALALSYPDSFIAASRIASTRSISLEDAYVILIGMTPQEAGARLAERCGFPRMFIDAMRHYTDPENAVENKEMVAIVAFSSSLCRRYNIGSNGAPAILPDVPLDTLPGWSIIKERVFPSFDINRFGDVMGPWSEDLCLKLSGRNSYVTD
jgi:HD-like signal output (HDOD) protein/ActR/RegA family two-component response regulator